MTVQFTATSVAVEKRQSEVTKSLRSAEGSHACKFAERAETLTGTSLSKPMLGSWLPRITNNLSVTCVCVLPWVPAWSSVYGDANADKNMCVCVEIPTVYWP